MLVRSRNGGSSRSSGILHTCGPITFEAEFDTRFSTRGGLALTAGAAATLYTSGFANQFIAKSPMMFLASRSWERSLQ